MAPSDEEQRKSCFVAMPITTPVLYVEKLGDAEHFAHVLEHLFRPALEKADYTVIPPSTLGAELIHAEIIKNLEQADLVLCDLSSLNPNVFFELGIRTSLDRPVAIVKDHLTPQIPFDLNAINTLSYDGSLTPWTLDKETERVADHVKNVAASANGGNAMWHYFGLTKRADPSEAGSNPVEAKLDLVLREVTRLQNAWNPDQVIAEVEGVRARLDEREREMATAFRRGSEAASHNETIAIEYYDRIIAPALADMAIDSETRYDRSGDILFVFVSKMPPERQLREIKAQAEMLGIRVRLVPVPLK